MTYKIIRIDGKKDELTAQSFDNYSDAYDLLEELYGDLSVSYTHLTLPTKRIV